jgi:hypothetical protein
VVADAKVNATFGVADLTESPTDLAEILFQSSVPENRSGTRAKSAVDSRSDDNVPQIKADSGTAKQETG